MPTITYTERLETEVCWCGINHAIPANLARQAREQGTTVYCPLGHAWVVKKSEAVKLRERLEREQARAASLTSTLDQERASHAATKGQLTKARKRAAAAVCPVPGCKRQIVQMARHLASKHPTWEAEHDHS